MTTILSHPEPALAPVTQLLIRPAVEPAPVQVCHYCLTPFTPTRDPDDGSLWDLDDQDKHCCDDCYCPKCTRGHHPDQSCPATLEPTDREIVVGDEAAVYGDPDARYDAHVDMLLGDCE